jgi:hypothetical protein
MGVVMERWWPTQQMLGVFLRRMKVKKLLFVCAIGLAALTSASAEPKGNLGLSYVHPHGCGSSWEICRQKYQARIAHARTNPEAAYARTHPGVPWWCTAEYANASVRACMSPRR